MLVGLVVSFVLFVSPAYAADIDMTQVILTVVGSVFSILGIVVTALINKYVSDNKNAALMEKALQNSLGFLQQVTEGQVTKAHISIPDVPDSIAPAVQYVIGHAGSSISHFGLTDQDIAEKIIARIGVKNIETNIAVAGSSVPLIPEPVAPVPANVALPVDHL